MKTAELSWQELARRQLGAISHRQLADAGLSNRQIAIRVERGDLERAFRGVYLVGGAPPTSEQTVMAACLATGGVASHRCAARLWSLRACDDLAVEVTVCGRRRPELAGVTGHTTSELGVLDTTTRMSIPVTTPARTLLDLGAVAPETVVESAVEDALHRGIVTRSWLARTLERSGAAGRDGTAVLRRVLASRPEGAVPTESTLEDEIVRLVRAARLPPPVRQHAVRPAGEREVRIDLCYPRERVAIEAQSLAWHAGRADLQRDCEKRNLLVRLGWRVLVFTWHDVRRRSRYVVEEIRLALCGVGRTSLVS